MGQRPTVEKLPAEEFDFVINCLLNNRNDREVSLEFETKYKKKLPKSNIASWRKKAGDELIDRYRMARFQAKQLRENLELEEGEDYQNVIKNIEEHLLTATRKVIHENPARLLLARQREENFRLKREQREKFERTQNLQSDKFKIASESWKYILAYFTNLNSPVADDLTKHSKELIEGLGEYIEQI
jgi:hypothetical protein